MMVCPNCEGRGCEYCQGDSDAAIERLRLLLAPAPARYDTEEILHAGGGSSFKVKDGDASLIFSTSDQPESATVVTMRLPGEGVFNFTISRSEAIALMAHLSEVAG